MVSFSSSLGAIGGFDLTERPISSIYAFLFALDAFIITSAVPQLLNECKRNRRSSHFQQYLILNSNVLLYVHPQSRRRGKARILE